LVVEKGIGLKGRKEQGTRNKEQGTRNKEQGTRNKEQGTRNKKRLTADSWLVPASVIPSAFVFFPLTIVAEIREALSATLTLGCT
jgi:hypothetical protein